MLTWLWATKASQSSLSDVYIKTCGYGDQLKQQFLSCGVRYVACHVQVTFSMVSVAFGCVCLSLNEVFAVS